jgi:hypothetical protein
VCRGHDGGDARRLGGAPDHHLHERASIASLLPELGPGDELIHERDRALLTSLARRLDVQVQAVIARGEPSHHLSSFLLRSREEHDALIVERRSLGILAVSRRVPLHSSPMGQRIGGALGTPPVPPLEPGDVVRRLDAVACNVPGASVAGTHPQLRARLAVVAPDPRLLGPDVALLSRGMVVRSDTS